MAPAVPLAVALGVAAAVDVAAPGTAPTTLLAAPATPPYVDVADAEPAALVAPHENGLGIAGYLVAAGFCC